ncbi:ATP-binding protein [Desulfovibrio sp. SGI.169]|uniref:ATP-binding protein n=1 Tax=Desulfovibrio sp. SGI.169 TaxID=3420561 RepID=UPI003D018F32
MMSVIFICGIHGAGKTTFGRKLSERIGLPHFSSSDLIRKKTPAALPTATGEKRVSNSDQNQATLIEAVNEIHEKCPVIILDGHATILDPGGVPVPIDKQIFQSLDVCALIFLDVAVKKIAEQLERRDGKHPALELLSRHRKAERAHAQTVAESLRCLFRAIDGSEESLNKVVKDLTQNLGGVCPSQL